ncbi:MAG: threonine synthase [Coriobacteriia bacterium]|nr:threonine synthase [Coriobacteriia bacterium]
MKPVVHYRDTRGLARGNPAFTDVVARGIAPGGGLYVPASLPELTLGEILAVGEMPYWRRAAAIFSRFGVDVSDERIDTLMQRAYGSQWDDARIAPVVEARPDMHVLELWHGPTSAFKDMALQCMPLFFSEAISMLHARERALDDYLILVATSGDTGKAALEGFVDREHTNIIVFYPADGVSELQRKQMITQRGSNVSVFGVRGNFDDCQNAVKAAFNDEEFNAELHDRWGIGLSSANSINWGRMLPQVVYYVSAYADMVAGGGVKAGDPIDVCVPTGNFGNILGAFYAKEIGVPIDRLLCASNENNVLSDFIATGVYDISERHFVKTPSPSMDILISSNLERLLYHLTGSPSAREWTRQLAEEKHFGVDRDTFTQMRDFLVGDYVTNDTSLATIRRAHEETGYLPDPHTAVAWEVAERLRGENPVLVVSTAHWAKFGVDVFKALSGIPYSEPLPAQYEGSSAIDILAHVRQIAPEACVPSAIAELDTLPERFTRVVDAGRDGIETAVRDWLSP